VATYPGSRQILRYLRLEQEYLADGGARVRVPVLDDLLDAGGAMRLGALAPACDLAAGALSNREVAPDWVATLDFKLHLAGLVTGGHVDAEGHVLRAGRNTVLSEMVLTDTGGTVVGRSYVTFSRLPRREGAPQDGGRVERPARLSLAEPDREEPRIPLDEYLGLRFAADHAGFELDHHPRIHNSFGSVQGGAMAALLERAATLAGERAWGRPARTLDLHFSYAAQARNGPFRVRADPIRVDGTTITSRVQLTDAGLDDRLAAVGTATAHLIEQNPIEQ
jgi:uncharacterized protein (TIGR00369 family)